MKSVPDISDILAIAKNDSALTLADVVSGMVDLEKIIREHATSGPPPSVMNVSIPVYTKGSAPVVIEPLQPSVKNRQFVVEAGPNIVLMEGEIAVAPQAGIRFHIFHILWISFLEDLKDGLPPSDFHPINVEDLASKIHENSNKYFDDLTTIRRAINHLQHDIETTVKRKLGLPIDREDIIQTCRWKSQDEGDYGYRINPLTVVARPFQTNRF